MKTVWTYNDYLAFLKNQLCIFCFNNSMVYDELDKRDNGNTYKIRHTNSTLFLKVQTFYIFFISWDVQKWWLGINIEFLCNEYCISISNVWWIFMIAKFLFLEDWLNEFCWVKRWKFWIQFINAQITSCSMIIICIKI